MLCTTPCGLARRVARADRLLQARLGGQALRDGPGPLLVLLVGCRFRFHCNDKPAAMVTTR